MREPEDEIPFLTDEQIKLQAAHFLNSMGRGDELPIDIDAICDDLDIGVIALPIEKNFGVDAYISSDFSTIVVDEHCYHHNIPRARFSLAHEVAHFQLHRAFYERQGIGSIEEYIKFQNSIDPRQWKRMEIQADKFAGSLLVPSAHLASTMEEYFEAPAAQIVTGSMSDIRKLTATAVKKFHVSEMSLLLSIKRDFPDLHASLLSEIE